MAGSMLPFVASQVHAVVEGIRLLEFFVTAPLGLHADIKMLRESLPLAESADLSREELQQRRTAFVELTDQPREMALGVVSSIGRSLDTLALSTGTGGSPFEESWVAQARRVLARATQRVATDIRSGAASRVKGLYVVVDPEATKGRPVFEVAEAAISGGAAVLQLRDKTMDKGEVLVLARQLRSLCESAGALFVVNDDADLALCVEAHGLHVGQTDLPVAEARRVLTPTQIVGRSNNTVAEAMDSQAQGADYLAVGAIYPTSTVGKGQRNPVGIGLIGQIKDLAPQPVVAIGGINGSNIGEVVRAGADCVCVVSAVTFADDPKAATSALVEAMLSASTA